MQPESELGASKKKQTQINTSNFGFFLLLFIYVYFLESRLFNGLPPIQIKKFPFLSTRL